MCRGFAFQHKDVCLPVAAGSVRRAKLPKADVLGPSSQTVQPHQLVPFPNRPTEGAEPVEFAPRTGEIAGGRQRY
jgi:hypothetical protein